MIQARIRGREQVIANIGKKQLQMDSAALKWVNVSTKTLNEKVISNINLVCHSLADLAAMDPPHPYAKKHLNNPHSPYYKVHMQIDAHGQFGQMRARLKKEVVSDRQEIRSGVGYTEEAERELRAPRSRHSYLRCIIFGTEHMVGRDFLNGSLGEIKEEIKRHLLTRMIQAAQRRV